MKTTRVNHKTIREEILLELWQNALFDNNSYTILEDLIVSLAHKKESLKENIRLFKKEITDEVSTIRNRHLITIEQQKKLQNTVVGFFGMSVGSHAALTWMMESRANVIKIMDHDTISPSNLNRLRFGWNSIGNYKVDEVKTQLEEINPFTKVIESTKIDEDQVHKFFFKNEKLDIIVDAIDDMKGKILLRRLAKENKLPLVSAADVGDNVILDIERYDIAPQPQMFLGRIPELNEEDFTKLSDIERKKMIVRLVGLEENSEQLLDSLLAIGRSLKTWPQLGATATITGGVITTTIKKIILNENVESGRYYLSLDNLLLKDLGANAETRIKEKKEKVKRKFKLI